MARLSGAKRTALANYANIILGALIGFAVSPILLAFLGSSLFGAWKSLQRFFDLGGAADGGAMQGLKWVIAHSSAKADPGTLRRKVGAALVVFAVWLPVLLLIAIGLAWLAPRAISGLSPQYGDAVQIAAAILALNLVLTSFAAFPNAVLVGTNQGYRSTVVTTCILLASNAAMAASVLAGFSLPALAVVTSVGTLLNAVITFMVMRRAVRWWGVARPSRAEVRSQVGLGGWVFVWGLVVRLFAASETLLLSVLVGAGSVAALAFTGYVPQFGLAVVLMTVSAITPRLGAMLGSGDSRARDVVTVTRELSIAVSFAIGSGMILLNRSFVELWAGPSMYLGNAANGIIASLFVQQAIIRSEAQMQDTGLRVRNKVLLGAGGAVLGLATGACGYWITGSTGGLLAGLFIGRVPLLIVFPMMVGRLVEHRRWPWKSTLVAALLLALCMSLGPVTLAPSWATLVAQAALASVVIAAASYFLILSPAARRMIRP